MRELISSVNRNRKLLLVVLILSLLVLGTASFASNKKSGDLEARGTVLINGVPVSSNVTVTSDSRIVTRANSGAIANIPGLGQIFVGEDSELMLTFEDKMIKIELISGTVRVQGAGEALSSIKTRTCGRVDVLNGAVSVQDKDKGKQDLTTGQSKQILNKGGLLTSATMSQVDYRVSTVCCTLPETPDPKSLTDKYVPPAGSKNLGELKPNTSVIIDNAKVSEMTSIASGARIITPHDGGAVAQLGEAGQLLIGENSDLTVDFEDNKVKIQVLMGSVRVKGGARTVATAATKSCGRVEVIDGIVKVLGGGSDNDELKGGDLKEMKSETGFQTDSGSPNLDFRISATCCQVSAPPRTKNSNILSSPKSKLIAGLVGAGATAAIIGGVTGGGNNNNNGGGPTPVSTFRP